MNILVLSCSTGQGHNAAANAVAECFIQHGDQCVVAETMRFAGKRTERVVSGAYRGIILTSPKLFGVIYHLGKRVSSSRHHSVIYFANKSYAESLESYLVRNHFAAIVCTHLYPAEALTYLAHHSRLDVPFFAVATDYTCVPFWEEVDSTVSFVPHAALKSEYMARGIPESGMVASGIPVSSAFSHRVPADEARTRLGLPSEGRNYLVMTGGEGCTYAKSLTGALLSHIGPEDHIVMIAGRNKALYEQLSDLYRDEPRVICVSFTDQVSLYMDACNVMLSKAGGLSSTEAAVKHIPLVHIHPIPGCETYNAQFFSFHGMSVYARDNEEAACLAVDLASDPGRCERIKQQQAAFIPQNASETIYRTVTEYLERK